MQIEENIPLAQYTTFHIGGPARFFVRVKSVEDLKQSLDFARDKALAVLVLGGGSNILVDDTGFDGLVIKVELLGIENPPAGGGDEAVLIAGAGESWDAIVVRTVQENLWGVENLSGIPGTAGAAPVQNIGAYGAELKNTLAWVEVLDTQTQEVKKMTGGECGFGYRTSVFKKNPGTFVILRVALGLRARGAANISYRDLAEAFRGVQNPTLQQIRAEVLAIRAKKFPDVAKEGTAGSFFLNPIVTKEKSAELAAQYPALPQFPAEQGIKISLAWLLDNVLGLNGAPVGGARLFERQPLVIVAQKNTSSRDVQTLAEKVQQEVKNKLGIEIEREVKII